MLDTTVFIESKIASYLLSVNSADRRSRLELTAGGDPDSTAAPACLVDCPASLARRPWRSSARGCAPALQRLASKSKEHLARSFRRYLNKSPTEFVNDLRLEYCARRIISTKTKIVDICGDIGYESVSHFYHLFHKRYGLAPNEFRRKATDRDLNDALVGDPILESGIPEGISFLGQVGSKAE